MKPQCPIVNTNHLQNLEIFEFSLPVDGPFVVITRMLGDNFPSNIENASSLTSKAKVSPFFAFQELIKYRKITV